MGKKERGSRTFGKGSQKKGRGAGNRGGVGKAGESKHEKRPQKKKGKYGFKRPQKLQKDPSTINVGTLAENVEKLEKKNENVVKKEQGTFSINLEKMGIDKLLGRGKVDKKLIVKVENASEKAVKKIKESGGSIAE